MNPRPSPCGVPTAIDRASPIGGVFRTAAGVTIAAALGVAAPASAQWTVTRLNTLGAAESVASGVRDGRVVGWVRRTTVNQAALWTGFTEPWLNLRPIGTNPFYPSSARDVTANAVVGTFNNHACWWSGGPGSWVDLHPADARSSVGTGVEGGVQVGEAVFDPNRVTHAGLWHGTPGSWVDLNPDGAKESHVYDILGNRQAGSAVFTPAGPTHAGVWSGTASSWVDPHPAGCMASIAVAVHGNEQVGRVVAEDTAWHAALWHGTPDWVDLTPQVAGALTVVNATANAVWNGRQVGWVSTSDGITRASLWSGTAASWEDLSKILPTSWMRTESMGVWDDGTTVYVCGRGVDLGAGRFTALLWTRPVCRGDFNASGEASVQDVFDFLGAFFADDTRADYTLDGERNIADVLAFLAAYFQGC